MLVSVCMYSDWMSSSVTRSLGLQPPRLQTVAARFTDVRRSLSTGPPTTQAQVQECDVPAHEACSAHLLLVQAWSKEAPLSPHNKHHVDSPIQP